MTHIILMKRAAFSAGIIATLALAGCGKSADAPVAAQTDNKLVADVDSAAINSINAATPAIIAVPPTDAWVGRWTGPEGLFLDITKDATGNAGHYTIINRDTLDREETYKGIGEGSTIRFVRDGKDMTARPGSGAETGFKWLADKKDCLIVVPDQEGYCRDK